MGAAGYQAGNSDTKKQLLLGDIAYCDTCYRSVVRLSVRFVHCAQTAEDIDTISFANDIPVSPGPLDRVKFSFLHRSTLHPQILLQSEPLPVELSVGDIRRQIAAEWLSQWPQQKTYRKPPSLFRMVPSLTACKISLHPNGGSYAYELSPVAKLLLVWPLF